MSELNWQGFEQDIKSRRSKIEKSWQLDIVKAKETTQSSIMKILDFPESRQPFTYDCGASAYQQQLMYYGREFREEELIKALNTVSTKIFNNGTKFKDIISFTKKQKLKYDFFEGLEAQNLIDFIDKKIPVLILLQAYPEKNDHKKMDWSKDYKDGHYVNAIGYTKDKIIFEDPSSFTRTFLTFTELNERWHGVNDEGKNDEISKAFIIYSTPNFKSNEIKHMD